jgi:hypothetical protein
LFVRPNGIAPPVLFVCLATRGGAGLFVFQVFANLGIRRKTWRAAMANREQKNNREKKKPKADKKAAPVAAKPGFAEPALIRKPHKGKDWT